MYWLFCVTNAYRSLFLCFYSQFVSFYCGHSWLLQNDIQNMVSYIGVSSYIYIYIYIAASLTLRTYCTLGIYFIACAMSIWLMSLAWNINNWHIPLN